MRSLMITIIGLLSLNGAGVARAQAFDFKGIVLAGRSSIDVLQEQHRLNCDVVHRTENGVKCLGEGTMLGEDGTLIVYIDNEDVVRGIRFTYQPKDFVKNLKLGSEIEKALIEKFGRPVRRFANNLTWSNKEGHVVVFSGSPASSTLDMRGGAPRHAPKLNETQKKDL